MSKNWRFSATCRGVGAGNIPNWEGYRRKRLNRGLPPEPLATKLLYTLPHCLSYAITEAEQAMANHDTQSNYDVLPHAAPPARLVKWAPGS
jgi:hypothetical protein